MVDRLVNSEANLRRIKGVESCFGSSGQPLVVPARVLVGEGVLTKLCRKKPKPRQFFLFNDILVYGNIVINKKKYNKQHVIPLEEVKLLSLEDDGSKAGIFQITNPQVENLAKIFVKIANIGLKNGWQIISSRKSFAVYAATATEKAEWMAHINKCIQDLFAKTGKKASDNHAAVWVPDSEASTCMHCMKTKFTALNRRHHCRKCGAVVCGGCSPKKAMLPAQSSKPLRVCSTCYDASNKGKVPQDIKKTDAKDTKDDDDSSGEENSDEEEAGTEGGAVNQEPTTPTFYQQNAPSEQQQQHPMDEGN